MKNPLLLTAFLLYFTSNAQMSLDWMTNTELGAANFSRVIQDHDGNVIHVKLDEAGGFGNSTGFVQKYTPEGTLLWQFGETDFTDGSNNQFLDVAVDSENNVYVVGTQFDNNDLYPKTEIIKISIDGTEVWRTNFTTTPTWSEAIEQIEITSDDRIYLIARLYEVSVNTIPQALIEMDTDGNTVFILQDPNYELPLAQLSITEDNEIFVLDDSRIIRVDGDGNEIFSFNYSDDPFEFYLVSNYDFNSLSQNQDYIFVCHGKSSLDGITNSFAVSKTATDGSQFELVNIIPFPQIDNMLSVIPTYLYTDSNGAVYVCGYMFYGEMGGPVIILNDETSVDYNRGGKGGSGDRREFVVKLNSDLSLAWSKDYDFMFPDADALPAGGFFHGNNFVYHTSIQLQSEVLPYFIAHNDETGDIIWTYTEQPSEAFSTYSPSSLITGNDDAIYAFGRGELHIDDQMQYQTRYISRYTLSDFIQVNEMKSNANFSIYPNPVLDVLNFRSDSNDNQIVVFDATGRRVMEVFEKSAVFQINLNELNSGIYYIQLNGEALPIVKQ